MISAILAFWLPVACVITIIGILMYNDNKKYMADYYDDDKYYEDERFKAKLGARMVFGGLLWPFAVPFLIFYGIKKAIPHIQDMAKAAS